MGQRSFIALLLGSSAAMFGAVFFATGPRAAQASGGQVATPDVYYAGCNAVRAAGKAPLRRGQPGYRIAMDGDGDGVACEPYAGSGSRDGGGSWSRSRRRRR